MTTAPETHSLQVRLTFSTIAASTAVATIRAEMMVCERNSGIRRADTMVATKPTMSNANPIRNGTVSMVAAVERSVGCGVFERNSVLC